MPPLPGTDHTPPDLLVLPRRVPCPTANGFAAEKLFYVVVAIVTDEHFVHRQSLLEHTVLVE